MARPIPYNRYRSDGRSGIFPLSEQTPAGRKKQRMATSSDLQRSLNGVEITGPVSPAFAEILTPDALAFVATLAREFEGRREKLLHARAERQARIDAGQLPDFLPETAAIRSSEWTIAPTPADLQDRRVEITGPVERKMMINALNSGAKVFMADFEDSHSPTWDNVVTGQVNLQDAVRQ